MRSFDQAAEPEPAPQDGPAADFVSPARLDEAKLRRPDFERGHQVVLADGQAWHVRRPRIYFEPSDNQFGFRVGYSDGDDETAAIRDALDALGPQPLIADLAKLELKLAGCALRRNYDLSPAQISRLLRFGYDSIEEADPDAVRIRTEVMAALMGESGPKAEDGGDA